MLHHIPHALTRAILLLGIASVAQAQDGAAVISAPATLTTPATSTTLSLGAGPASAQSSALSTAQGTTLSLNGDANAAASAKTAANPSTAPAEAPAATPLRRPRGTSLFQQFVQESTGRSLPVFGTALFDSPGTYATNTALPPPGEYVLGPGDEVNLQIWGAVDLNGSFTLDRNGQITLPKVGVVPLAGVSVNRLDSVLRSQISKVFTNFQLNTGLGRLRSIQVYVVGQAEQPGTYNVSSLSTLVNALFASGGPSASGSMRNIQLKRGGRTVTTLDLYDFIARGDKAGDLPLQSGDVIVIPPVGPRVAVTGAFDHAAIYELKPGANTLGSVLGLNGGVPALASSRKALLERIAPEQQPPRRVQDLALDASGLSQPLRDGDVITLLGISPAFANAVTLQGTVAAPLRSPWFEGMRVLDLIPERDALITADYYRRKNLLVQSTDAAQDAGKGITQRVRTIADQINWEYAVIERLNRNTLATELLPFNLGKAVLQRDAAHNLVLQPGDVITVLSQNDLRLPLERQTRLVRVEGEVAAPGVYQTLPGETLPQLLQRVGGLTPQAYLFGTELSRQSVRTRQQENLGKLVRQLEAQLQAQSSALAANQTTEAAQAQQLQQAQLKAQIDRLKSANSNGRMSLELDTQASSLSALPGLPLEDGDRVLVPATPGFVAAMGAVNNENVFIHKPGKTVGDIMASAGLTEDAEPDQAFVLRADGSIVARRDRGFFGGDFTATRVMPGDTVVVPAKLDRESRYSFITRAVKDWTQIFANLGLGVAAINSIKN